MLLKCCAQYASKYGKLSSGHRTGNDQFSFQFQRRAMPKNVQSTAMVFSVIIYRCELNHKESWAPNNWCFWIVVLGKTLQSPLDCKEMRPVNPKGNQTFSERTDAGAKASILCPLDAKKWFIRKDNDVWKDWRQEEKEMIEDEMLGWHHWLNENESEQTLGHSEDREAWRAAVHRVARSWMWLNDWTSTTT